MLQRSKADRISSEFGHQIGQDPGIRMCEESERTGSRPEGSHRRPEYICKTIHRVEDS